MPEENTTVEVTTAAEPEQTQPQAVNVDNIAGQAKASGAGEKETESVFKAMLKQEGLDTATIAQMTAEWKSKQVTPEQTAKEKDDTILNLQKELEAVRYEKIALSKGVPVGSADEALSEKANACMTLARSYVTDDVPFDKALEKALQVISFAAEAPAAETPPPMYGGAGKSTVNPTEKEKMIAVAKAAIGVK